MKPTSGSRYGDPNRQRFNRDAERGGGSERSRQPGGSGSRNGQDGQPSGPGHPARQDAHGQAQRHLGGGPRIKHDWRVRPLDQDKNVAPQSNYEPNSRGGNQLRSPPSRDNSRTPRGAGWLYGHHAVAAALANPSRRLRRLMLTQDAEATLVQRFAPPWPLQHERVERNRIDQLLGRDIAHQGAALLADPLTPPNLQHALGRPGPLLVLDQVTDPRNVGAILRAAASFGAAAVIAQDRNAPEETGALAKAASGALETMPLLRVVNISRTLIALKAANIWVVGLDADGGTLLGPALAGRRVALVLGAEGSGLRRLTRETCDEILGFTMQGGIGSLNVSVAAAVALYELTRRSEA